LIDLPDIAEFPSLIQSDKYDGFNVTIPHKRAIIPYLDSLSLEAQAIGAVNVIEINNNKLIGHNTDIIGFHETFTPLLKPNHTHAVILGTGGASQAVQYVLNKLNIPFRLVTHNELDTNTITQLAPIIINTTPLGMHPHINTMPNIDYSQITPNHLIYDLVYNPTETQFLQLAKQQGATTQNGLAMLYTQADAALKIWLK
jgi:shikimate dehydrogenase